MKPRSLQDEQSASAKAAGFRLDERYARLRAQRTDLHLPHRDKISDLERNQALVTHSSPLPTVNRSGNEGAPLKAQRCPDGPDRQRARCFELNTQQKEGTPR